MNALRRLGGMLAAPRATLRAIATAHVGDVLEPLLLWLGVLLLLRAHEAYRLLSLLTQAPGTVGRRLLDLVVDDARNDFVLLLVVAVALGAFGRYVAKRPIAFGAGVTAAGFLLVPLVALKAAGGLLALAGLDLWWLPHWPVDSLQVIVVDRQVDWSRFALKCVVAYGPSLVLLLGLARFLMKPAPLAESAPAPPAARAHVGLGALGALVLALTAVTAVDVAAKSERLKAAVPGNALPTTALPWLHKQGRVDTGSYRGQVLVLDFWASWCAPCRRSIPELTKLHDELAAQGLVVLGVNREPYDKQAAKQAWRALAPSFDSVVDDRGYGERLGLTSLPTSYVVDRKGVIRALHLGYTEISIVRDEVLRLLAEAP